MQQLLTNLLPGLRELRAPLTAGYLWLTFIWLLVAEDLPEQAPITGLLSAIYRLIDALGPVSAAIATSLVAYLIGAVSETLFDAILRGLS